MKRKDKNGILLRKGEYQLDNGRYQYKYTDCFGNRHSFNAETLDELRDLERQAKREDEEGRSYAAGEITVIDLVKRYLKLKTKSRYNTQVCYKTISGIIEREPFGKRKIRDIKVSDAKLWFIDLQSRGFRYCTITNIRGVVKPAFDMAWEEEIIRRNPFMFKITDAIVNDTVPREALTEEEYNTWMSFIKNDKTYCKYYDEMVVLFWTGMRVSEFCGLTKNDLDFENRVIHVDHQLIRERLKGEHRYFVEKTKTESGKRYIPMIDAVYESLQNIIRNRKKPRIEHVIDGYTKFILIDKNMYPKVALHIEHEFKWARDKFDKLYPNNKLPHITPHVARHTFATRMAQNGMDVKALQYLMGHSDAGVTMNVYTHTDFEHAKKHMKKAAEELSKNWKDKNETNDREII